MVNRILSLTFIGVLCISTFFGIATADTPVPPEVTLDMPVINREGLNQDVLKDGVFSPTYSNKSGDEVDATSSSTPEIKNAVNQGFSNMDKGQTNMNSIANEFSPKTAIPSLFDDEENGCTFSADGQGGSVSCAAGVLGSPCEVVMSGIQSDKNTTGVDPKDMTCTEFVDPLPARFMKGFRDGGTYCIQQTALAARLNPAQATGSDEKNTFVFTSAYDADSYCIGLLHRTGEGDLTPILGFVMFVYNLMQPLLIIAGVISIVIAGIFIMYAPGGEGDTIKKGKEMLVKIISGFLLFFMIKVFLSTINGSFFTSTSPTPSASTSAPATGASTETEGVRMDVVMPDSA